MSKTTGAKSVLKFYQDFAKKHGYQNIRNIPFSYRFEEFEVVKNLSNDEEIDYISLNNLYDFYEVPFIESDIKHYIDTKIMCEQCLKITDEINSCERCEIEICHNCQASYNQFTQIDYTCCKSCSDPT